MLKTPHSLVTGHGDIKLILTREFLPHWLAFLVPERAKQAAGGGGR